ncbi:MAG: SpoIIE family protein phosphatase [Bacteroidales bacterium]|nr:SpoIIE family protein phosphatase [Bacteroidales bacterium]
MKRLIDTIRRSFSVRLSLWVVSFAALVFLAAMAYFFTVSRRYVREEAILRATQVVENSVLRLNNILEDVQLSADNLEWLVYRHLEEPEMMMEYSRITVQGNPVLSGCSISFEPDFFEGQYYYSAYSGYVGGTLETEQEGDEDYQYFYLDWYLQPKLLNQPCWTEPYSDWEQDDAEDRQTQRMVSYCKPLTTPDGYIGSISLDISLKWLSDNLSPVKPYPHSYSILVSRGGTFLVHPDPEKLFYQTIFTEGLIDPKPELDELGKSMQDLEAGYRQMEIDGVPSYVFFTPLKATGWSMAIVCPESDIFGRFNRLRRIIIAIDILGLLLLFLSCFRVIRKAMQPLSDLARQAEDIASGHFDTVLPENTQPDELGTLSRSFADMQSSLVTYMDELTRTTANKVRIEGELQIARNIQMGMIPQVFPPFPERKDIDLYASMMPAREVGGDLYDYFIQGRRLYFCIGDVSGKGVPASLFMTVVLNLFRAAGRQGLLPAEIAHQINETLTNGNEQLMFVTMFIGAIDLVSGKLDFCNCGHNPPVVLAQDEKPVFLSCKANMAIGVLSNAVFEGEYMDGFKDKPLFLYTDGLSEAENPDHELFGSDRLLAVLGEPYTDAETVVKRMQAAISDHVAGADPSDDLTMLCLEIKK